MRDGSNCGLTHDMYILWLSKQNNVAYLDITTNGRNTFMIDEAYITVAIQENNLDSVKFGQDDYGF